MAGAQVANRYSKALFELADERGVLDRVASDLESVAALIGESPEFAALVEDPLIPTTKQLALLSSIFSGKCDPLTQQFLEFIASKGRLDQLSYICLDFQALHDERAGVLRVNIVTASALAGDQQNKLAERLQTRFGKQIIATVDVDADLIGGFVVIAGDQVFDYSVRTQLNKFKQSIINA